MADDDQPEVDAPPAEREISRRRRASIIIRRTLIGALLAVLALIALGVVLLNSSFGHRFVTDQIAHYAPASGLRVSIGRIEGSLYRTAVLHDVTLSDPNGAFLKVPVAELDWRPFNWFTTGLDVRKLVARNGVLLRRPALNPGDPDAPILPRFDIRVDHLEIDNLTIPAGIAGSARRVDLIAQADIRDGRAYLKTNAQLGGSDKLRLLLDAAPARNRFALELDYAAPRGGVLAGLARADEALRARIVGKGSWQDWRGALLVEQGSAQMAALRLTNRSGRYGILGQLRPGDLLTGLAARAAGQVVDVEAQGTLQDSVLTGSFGLTGQGVLANGAGSVDLGSNSLPGVRLAIRNRDAALLGAGTSLIDGRLTATASGPFRDLAIVHRLTAAQFGLGGATWIDALNQAGTARYDGAKWTLPLDLTAARIITGNQTIDPRLVQARGTGTLVLTGQRLTSDDLMLAVPGLGARLTLRGDTARGGYALAGPVAARGFALPDLGLADATAQIVFRIGATSPWLLDAKLNGRMTRVDNATLTTLAGTGIRFGGAISVGGNQPLLIRTGTLSGSKLSLGLSGRSLGGGRTQITGRGRHTDYGPFTVDANIAGDGPRAVLVFADPLPAAGLRNVRVALAPIPSGFRIETTGGSTLGDFVGTLGLFARPGGPTRIEVEKLTVANTAVTGSLLLARGGVNGTLALTGGGVDGTIGLAPRSGGQGFDIALNANNARFGGPSPISIARGRIEASGLIAQGHTTITGNLFGTGISQGSLFLGRLAANATITDGRGQFTASLAGRRGGRFALQLQGDVAPDRIAVLGRGEYAGQRITMPRRAVLTRSAGGWALAPTQVDFGGGRAIASGTFGTGGTDLKLALASVPLSLVDIFVADLGLGGSVSGTVDYRAARGRLPAANFSVLVKGLTRSGLVLTSRPIDLALVGKLTAASLETRAVVREGTEVRGRLQGQITGLPAGGSLAQRLNAGRLFAQMRYAGPADALWRLIALEAFDLTGPVSLAADATGSLADPQIRGSVASDGMRLRSTLIGADVSNIRLNGRFAGPRLDLTGFSGRAANGGQISGSGTVDLSGLGVRPPTIDLKIAARNALLLSRDDMAATVTGPLRIVSSGGTGSIAGRLRIESARWQLGVAASAAALPNIRTREINAASDIAPPRAASAPWRFLIDAAGSERIAVRGLGLDSEWGANIRLRGSTAAPVIFGQADLVRGGYEFAGRRFEMTRGRISFDGSSPPNPRLDIVAEADVTGLTARVTVTGTSLVPEITFSSIPALPEEELLSRLLFGESVTDISAPEALQLGSALASLRGGGGLDPINKLRTAIGLDRLRIVSADAALGRGTGVAAGKYLGRRIYAEIISDGRGYSATQVEFRVTNWLSILGSISTVGRESVNVQVSKDY